MIQEGGPAGYTIIEVMVFLAITALLFIGAMTAVSGRQAAVQYSQGIRDTQSKMAEVINQVASGFYPNPGNFTCQVPNPNNATSGPHFSGASSAQGTSDDCVFLGKVMQFSNLGGSTGAVKYNLMSVTGRRLNNKGQEVSSLQEAVPTAIAGGAGPDVTEKNELQFGVKVTRIMVPSQPKSNGAYPASADNGISYGAVAFFSSLATFDANTGSLASGAQHVSFGAVPGTTLTDDENTAAGAINNLTDQSPAPGTKRTIAMNPPNGIVICLSDQEGKQKAMLTIGGSSSQTSVALDADTSYSTVVCP